AIQCGANLFVFARDRDAMIMSMDGRYPEDRANWLAGFYQQPIVLYRPPRQRWSYAELSSPQNCSRIIIQVGRGGTMASFGLFGMDLEKGVIFRGLVRGVFVPRLGDTRHCLRHFARLLAEKPRISV